MTEKEKIIPEVLINFDFDRVAEVMEFLDWKWAGIPEHVPDKYELSRRANELMHEAYDELAADKSHKTYTVATGGLKATAWVNEDPDENYNVEIGVRLEFILEDFEVDYF